ncbi:MFS transporter [Candidatus Paracaedibacter symbiosus]|uniref:MFS transporter n=1 Tax=Candidatus Paracaedibacter symbiosus TaxID=244582 RepID=UPI0012EB2BB6|nr:MFS transporter [Candidatus Paracaedibacter symbiosus]
MQKSLLYLLGMVFGVGIASNDIYLSALPHLSALHSITPWLINCTLVGYFIATAIASLLYAPLLSYIDRKQLFNLCVLLFSGASILISLSGEVAYIILGRILQGIAFGIIQPTLLATVREQFPTNTSGALAAMSFATEVFCTFIPTLGALSFTYVSWNSPFLIIGLIAAVLLSKAQPILTTTVGGVKSRINLISLKKLAQKQNFVRYNAISFLMIGLGWGMITMSAYLFDSPLSHGFFIVGTVHFMR